MSKQLTEKQQHYFYFAGDVLELINEIIEDKKNKKAIFIENYDFDNINTFNEIELEEFLDKINSQEYINSDLRKTKNQLAELLKKVDFSDEEIDHCLNPDIYSGPIIV